MSTFLAGVGVTTRREDSEDRSPRFIPELTGLLLSEQSVAGLLELIVNVAVSAVSDVDAASVSLLVGPNKRFETANATSPLVRDVDRVQYDGEAGPCVEAIRTGAEVTLDVTGDRWPDFEERAAAIGVRSVWSLPLQVRGMTTGALNLYSTGAEAWFDSAADTARSLAGHAAVVLANAAELTSAELTNGHLNDALVGRTTIGQAEGILMAVEHISADEAFDVLRRASQRTHRKLRDVAADVVANHGLHAGEG